MQTPDYNKIVLEGIFDPEYRKYILEYIMQEFKNIFENENGCIIFYEKCLNIIKNFEHEIQEKHNEEFAKIHNELGSGIDINENMNKLSKLNIEKIYIDVGYGIITLQKLRHFKNGLESFYNHFVPGKQIETEKSIEHKEEQDEQPKTFEEMFDPAEASGWFLNILIDLEIITKNFEYYKRQKLTKGIFFLLINNFRFYMKVGIKQDTLVNLINQKISGLKLDRSELNKTYIKIDNDKLLLSDIKQRISTFSSGRK
ncbi:MAG: hypothetical protein IPH57_17410 [Saprospiraceae bacterium]|nr:hypothetical protein [Saprospiraceae bacterium]